MGVAALVASELDEAGRFQETMDSIAVVFEIVGVAIIVIGAVYALLHGFRFFENPAGYFETVRQEFGRPLILGLEILVAADIIKTITVDPSIESVAVLAILVAVRIALSFALDIEIDGMPPWRRAKTAAEIEALAVAAAEGSERRDES